MTDEMKPHFLIVDDQQSIRKLCITIGTSLMDMSIGVLIAFRRTAALGLIAGIVASLGYMIGAAILTPDLWIEPLGALVKTCPAIVLMIVALLTLDNR